MKAALLKEFFFECPKCGVYRVSESTLKRFITKALERKLIKKLEKGAAGAKLKFNGGCPTCEPNQSHTVELVALQPRLN